MKYFKQETDYSCGASALRNCLKHFDINISEKWIRYLAKTSKRKGTTKDRLIKVAQYYGFEVKEYYRVTIDIFKKTVKEVLQSGAVIIVDVDNYLHWIPAIEYKNRKIKTIDTLYKIDCNKSIVQWVTMKEFTNRSHNVAKLENRQYFYFISLKYKND